MKILDLHAPIKERVVRANHQPFITKQLRKAIMTRSRLENKYNKYAYEENGRLYKSKEIFVYLFCERKRKSIITTLT